MRPDEDWIDFLRRTTAEARIDVQQLGYGTWIDTARKKKWQFAGKTSNSTENKWSKRLLDWRPFFRCIPKRDVGHPRRRWEDSIVAVAGGNWAEVARDAPLWTLLEPGYVMAK